MTFGFDLDLLRTFTAVVETGGFTRAADRVHLTQSTISQQKKSSRPISAMFSLSATAQRGAFAPQRRANF